MGDAPAPATGARRSRLRQAYHYLVKRSRAPPPWLRLPRRTLRAVDGFVWRCEEAYERRWRSVRRPLMLLPRTRPRCASIGLGWQARGSGGGGGGRGGWREGYFVDRTMAPGIRLRHRFEWLAQRTRTLCAGLYYSITSPQRPPLPIMSDRALRKLATRQFRFFDIEGGRIRPVLLALTP